MYEMLMNIGIGIGCFILGITCFHINKWNNERKHRDIDVTYYNGLPLDDIP